MTVAQDDEAGPTEAGAGGLLDVDGVATGIGSLPGADIAAALALVRDTLPDLPHLPELPGRGVGADLVGRGAALLVELPVDLQPHGWRLVDAPGRDQRRAASFLRADLDELAETFDGYAGWFKIQVAGPWTLAASLWLQRGERALTDPGARRDIVESLAVGTAEHLTALRGALPGARFVVQVDEPSLTAVLAGRLPTASGYGLVRALDPVEAEQGLATVVGAVHAAGAGAVLHSCADGVPIALLGRTGAQAISLDITALGAAGWDQIGELLETGVRIWAGVVPTAASVGRDDRADPAAGGLPSDTALAEAVRRPWRRIGLPAAGLRRVVVTPTCGLASAGPRLARLILERSVAAARALADASYDD